MKILTGIEKLLLSTLVARSETRSGTLAGGGVPGFCTLQIRLEISDKSMSAVAMHSCKGCSSDMEIFVDERALTSNIVILSKSAQNNRFNNNFRQKTMQFTLSTVGPHAALNYIIKKCLLSKNH